MSKYVLTLLLLLVAVPGFAQSPDDPFADNGFKPYGSVDYEQIDSINLMNRKLDLHIPLLNVPQRGSKLKLAYDIAYESTTFTYDLVPCEQGDSGQCIFPAYYEFQAAGGSYIRSSIGPVLDQFTMTVSDPFGSHSMYGVDSSHYYAADGSGYRTDTSQCVGNNPPGPLFITDAQGTVTQLYCQIPQFQDRTYTKDVNGNQFTYLYNADGSLPPNTPSYDLVANYIRDTTGNVWPMMPSGLVATSDYSGCTGPLPTVAAFTWTPVGVEGQSLPYKFCVGAPPAGSSSFQIQCTDTINDIQGCPGPLTRYAAPLGYQSVVLPNKNAYTFEYDLTHGDLTKVTLPSGGTISYTWEDGPYQIDDWQPGFEFARIVSSRTVDANDGTGPHQWAYHGDVAPSTAPSCDVSQINGLSSAGTYSVQVTGPDGNDVVHTFIASSSYECSTQYYSGSMASGSLLREVRIAYEGQVYPAGGILNIHPIRVTTVLENGQESSTERDFDKAMPVTLNPPYPGQPSVSAYISANQVVAERVYDYGQGAPGSLLRSTATEYKWKDDPGYLSANVVATPARQCISTTAISSCSSSTGMSSYVSYGYDESGSPSGYKGNPTSTHEWINTSGTTQDGYVAYNSNGMPSSITSKGVTNTVTYDANGIFPAEISGPTINGIAHNEWFKYDDVSGALLSLTDQNGSSADDAAHTSIYHYDPTGRPISIVLPGGGGATYQYVDTANPSSTETISASPNPNIVMTTVEDGLGRIVDHQVQDASGHCNGNVIHSKLNYDNMGRIYTKSTPYCSTSDGTYGLVADVYDELGRKKVETQADGSSKLKWSYSGNITTVTDEAGNSSTRTIDALRQLTNVTEPGSLKTGYTYDVLGNLLNVTQVGASGETPRTRSFTYDSLSRLLTSTNPEIGTICYGKWSGSVGSSTCQGGYDANGNLVYKTNANGLPTQYTYDALNRLTDKATPSSLGDNYIYNYDAAATGVSNGIGRLTSSGSQYSANSNVNTQSKDMESYSYDSMGRMTQITTSLISPNTPTATISAAYDLAGNPTKITYPDGRVISQTFDGAGRLATVTDATPGATPVNYIAGASGSSIGYTAAGAEQTFTLGNGVNQTNQYNNRLQRTRTMVSTPALAANTTGGNLLDRSISYNPSSPATCSNGSNNGNIWSIVDNLQTDNTQSFSYDCLNRLTTAAQSGGSYNHTYNIDSFGNMTITDNLLNSNPWGIDPSTNRLLHYVSNVNVYTYDNAGNLTSSGTSTIDGHYYAYNEANQLLAVDTGATAVYTYNASGERVLKQTEMVRGSYGSSITDYVYFGGLPMAEWNNKSGWSDYVYANGQRITRIDPGDSVHYYTSDHLGSASFITNSQGALESQSNYMPFGGELLLDAGDSNHYKFTGKERDQESGLDNFGARYFGSMMGRFTSPDWSASVEPVPYAKLENPQSLNLYAYLQNNPLGGVDADGHDPQTSDPYATPDGGADPCKDQGPACLNQQQQKQQQTPPIEIQLSYRGMPNATDPVKLSTDDYEFEFPEGGDTAHLTPPQSVPSSWLGTASSYFFSTEMLKDTWSCLTDVGAPAAFDIAGPSPSIQSTAAQTASDASQAGYAAALGYSAARGLTVPLRSSIFRGILTKAELFGKASAAISLITLDIGLATAAWAEYQNCN